MRQRKVIVNLEDYNNYIKEFGTTVLWDNVKIQTGSSFPKFLNISEEIFNGRKTNYEIVEDTNSKVLIKFKSISNSEYRIDILKEPNTIVWHISFSVYDSKYDDSYHNLTDRNESIDVLNRIMWILKDINRGYEYCIGFDDPSKDKIYQYMLKSISNWQKRPSKQYESGWAIYFKL